MLRPANAIERATRTDFVFILSPINKYLGGRLDRSVADRSAHLHVKTAYRPHTHARMVFCRFRERLSFRSRGRELILTFSIAGKSELIFELSIEGKRSCNSELA